MKIKIGISPLIFTSDYDENDKMITLFLADHSPFQRDIKLARESIPLSHTFKYSDKPVAGATNLMYLLAQVKGTKRRNLENSTKGLLQKYRLAYNWALSIKVVILTNTLLVPAKLEPIQAIFPSRMRYFIEGLDGESDVPVNADLTTKNLINAYKYPLLQFRRKVSKNEITTWLKQNWKEVQAMMNEAPDKDDIRIKSTALIWGQLVSYVLDEDKNRTYKEVFNTLQDSFGCDSAVEVPDETFLRVYHERYLKAFKNHTPSQ